MKKENKIKYINSWNFNLNDIIKYLFYLYYRKKILCNYKKSINCPDKLWAFHNILSNTFNVYITGTKDYIIWFDDLSNGQIIPEIKGVYKYKVQFIYLIDKWTNKLKNIFL